MQLFAHRKQQKNTFLLELPIFTEKSKWLLPVIFKLQCSETFLLHFYQYTMKHIQI